MDHVSEVYGQHSSVEDLEWKTLGPLSTMEGDYLFCVFPEAKLRSMVIVTGVKLWLKTFLKPFFKESAVWL